MICVSFGVLPLLLSIGTRRESASDARSVVGSTFEGFFALIVLVAFVSAPVTAPDTPIALPDWYGGIEPGAALDYLVQALSGFTAQLPLSAAARESGIAAAVGGLVIMLLVSAIRALCVLWENLAPPILGRRPLRLDLVMVLVFLCIFAAILTLGPVSSGTWLAAGQFSLLFLASLLGVAAFAGRRLRRPSGVVLAAATGLSLLFWWACIVQILQSAAAGNLWVLTAQMVLAALGGYCTYSLSRSFIALSRSRRLHKPAIS
jgi:hypothetical protein